MQINFFLIWIFIAESECRLLRQSASFALVCSFYTVVSCCSWIIWPVSSIIIEISWFKTFQVPISFTSLDNYVIISVIVFEYVLDDCKFLGVSIPCSRPVQPENGAGNDFALYYSGNNMGRIFLEFLSGPATGINISLHSKHTVSFDLYVRFWLV